MSFTRPPTLAERYGADDPAAVREVRRRVRRIVAFRGYGIPREDRRDLEQTVMIQIWEAVRREGFDPSGFWAFVELVAARRCIDHLRTRRRETSFEEAPELADGGRGPLGEMLDKEEVSRAREALSRLPEESRQLLQLRVAERMSYREIAERLGASEGAIRVRFHRCLKRARDLLASDETDETDETE